MSTSATPKSEPEHLSTRELFETSRSGPGLNSYHLHHLEIHQIGLGRTQGPVLYGLLDRGFEWDGPAPPELQGAPCAAPPTGPGSVNPRVSDWVEQQHGFVGRWSYGRFRQVQEEHYRACEAAADAAAAAAGATAARSGHIDQGDLADNERESETKLEGSHAVRITPQMQGEFSDSMSGFGLRHQRNVGVLSNVSSKETTTPQVAPPAASNPAVTAASASASGSAENVSDSPMDETTTPPPTPPPSPARRCESAPLQENPERMPLLRRMHSC